MVELQAGDSTNDRSPTVGGSGVPGSLLTLYVDDQAVGSVTVGEDGKWEIAIADLGVDGTKRFTAELVVPANVGGFTMREVAVFDSHGAMFVVGTLPDTYKPTADEGAFSDVVVRVDFMVSNAQIITLQVDPAIALASQQWVLTNVKAAQIIPGGTVTQFLGKASNADGDYEWKDMAGINVTVDTVAEKQLLAASQTTVDLTVTTTYGLAVYVAGLRLDKGTGADEWQPDANIPTRLKLGKSYAANTRGPWRPPAWWRPSRVARRQLAGSRPTALPSAAPPMPICSQPLAPPTAPAMASTPSTCRTCAASSSAAGTMAAASMVGDPWAVRRAAPWKATPTPRRRPMLAATRTPVPLPTPARTTTRPVPPPQAATPTARTPTSRGSTPTTRPARLVLARALEGRTL